MFWVLFINSCPPCYAEEYIGLDDNKYIGDLLADFKASKDRSKGEILHCKLTFKKKLFRESDEAVTDPMFVQLCYVQVCVIFDQIFLILTLYGAEHCHMIFSY